MAADSVERNSSGRNNGLTETSSGLRIAPIQRGALLEGTIWPADRRSAAGALRLLRPLHALWPPERARATPDHWSGRARA